MTEYQATMLHMEKVWLEKTMLECKYNQSKACKVLGMSRGTLRTKLAYHFDDKYFRDKE